MKILLVTGEYPPMQGGVGDYSYRYAEAMSELGEEVSVLTSVFGDSSSNEMGTCRNHERGKPSVDGVERCVSYAVPRWTWRSWSVIKRRILAERPDVVHVQYQAAAYGMLPFIHLVPACIRTWGIRPNVVVTFHDLRIPYLFRGAGPLRARAIRWLSKGADAVVVTNDEDLEPVRRWTKGLVRTIPIGSNILNTTPPGFARSAQRQLLGLQDTDIAVAFFGFLNDSKGLLELLDAVAALRDQPTRLTLMIVGGGGGGMRAVDATYERAVHQRIDELNLRSAVIWTGYLGNEDVSAHLLAADLCVLPFKDGVSLRRGTLMAALEHGLPLISTVPSHPIAELQNGVHLLLARSTKSDDLVPALRRLSTDAALRSTLSIGASEAARKFAWRTIAIQHGRLYRDLWHKELATR